jgi:hypothetical protein
MALPKKIQIDQTRSATRTVVVDREKVDRDVGFKCTSISNEDEDGVRIVELEITNGDQVYSIKKHSDRIDVLLRQFEELGILSEYVYFPEPSITIIEEESFDSGLLQGLFTSLSTRPWSVQTSVFSSGPAAAESGDVGDLQSSILKINYTTVQDDLKIKFKWKVSCQDGDGLSFMINEVLQDQISGEADWSEVTYDLEKRRAYTFKWVYSKDSLGSAGSDAGWVDDVIIYS